MDINIDQRGLMFEWLKRKMRSRNAVGGTAASYDPSSDYLTSANLFDSFPDSSPPDNIDTSPCDTSDSSDAGSCDSGFDGGGGDAGGGGASGDF